MLLAYRGVLRAGGELIIPVVLLVICVGVFVRISGIDRQASMTSRDKEIVQNRTSSAVGVSTMPSRMIFPRIDLGIDVAKAEVDLSASAWPLSDKTAHYADFSAKFGDESGTMLLYGHNTWPVLKKTHDLTIGDNLILIDTQGQTWQFKLTKLSNVTPDQVGFIYEDTPFRVVVFTCNGWNDEYRRLMYFEPVQ